MKILVLNSGSSSQKSSLFEIADAIPENPPEPVWQAQVEWKGDQAELRVKTSQGAECKEQITIRSQEQGVEQMLDTLFTGKTRAASLPSEIDVVGHRVVNGGRDFEQPAVVSAAVRAAISRMSAFAPLHNRAELQGMDIIEKRFGRVVQVAVFDT